MPGLAKKVIFHQDNACLLTSVIAMAKINELRYELLSRPPYSHLPQSDFHLFPKLKIFLSGWRFSTTEELKPVVERGILQAWRNLIFEIGSRHWNIAGPNVIVFREAMLKNKNSSTDVRHFFLVHSENFSNHPRVMTHFLLYY